MNRLERQIVRDLRQIADRATPSPNRWNSILTRIAAQDPDTETEIIMLTDDTSRSTRRWLLWLNGLSGWNVSGCGNPDCGSIRWLRRSTRLRQSPHVDTDGLSDDSLRYDQTKANEQNSSHDNLRRVEFDQTRPDRNLS